MKRSQVSIPWREGLHARPATRLVRRALGFRSSIRLKVGQRMADARSIFAVLLLCASFGSVVEVEVSGTDEDQALAAITSVFEDETDADLNSSDHPTGRADASKGP